MHKLYNVQDKLIRKIEEYDDANDISRSNAEEIKILSSAADHIGNICRAAEEGDEYSNRAYPDGMGGSYRGGRGTSYRGPYMGNGSSYARGRMNARRDSMGRYSGNGYSRDDGMLEELRELMQDAPNETIKRDIQRLVDKIEQQQ